ncbi:MAG: hypothetical protein QM775_16310 [Pirellulales bacterium]
MSESEKKVSRWDTLAQELGADAKPAPQRPAPSPPPVIAPTAAAEEPAEHADKPKRSSWEELTSWLGIGGGKRTRPEAAAPVAPSPAPLPKHDITNRVRAKSPPSAASRCRDRNRSLKLLAIAGRRSVRAVVSSTISATLSKKNATSCIVRLPVRSTNLWPIVLPAAKENVATTPIRRVAAVVVGAAVAVVVDDRKESVSKASVVRVIRLRETLRVATAVVRRKRAGKWSAPTSTTNFTKPTISNRRKPPDSSLSKCMTKGTATTRRRRNVRMAVPATNRDGSVAAVVAEAGEIVKGADRKGIVRLRRPTICTMTIMTTMMITTTTSSKSRPAVTGGSSTTPTITEITTTFMPTAITIRWKTFTRSTRAFPRGMKPSGM